MKREASPYLFLSYRNVADCNLSSYLMQVRIRFAKLYLVKYNLSKLINHNNILILFLVILVISIGLISSNISNIRDPRPQAATSTVTFTVSADSDDGWVVHQGSSWPPPFLSASTGQGPVAKTVDEGTYAAANFFVRWNTSSIPDSAFINSAILIINNQFKCNDNGRNITADWYNFWPIDSSDYTVTAQTGAISGVSISNIPALGDYSFTLSNVGNISKTSYTGLRFHVSGGIPTGCNAINFRSHTGATDSLLPRLKVTYSVPDPVPTASIWADDTSISYNSATTIRWSSSNASSCSVAPTGWTGTSGNKPTGNLTSTKTYTLTCNGAGGSVQKSVTVNVGSPPPPPPPPPAPDPTPDPEPPPDGGVGTPQPPQPPPPPPGGGLPILPPPPPSIPGVAAPIDSEIVNILKINLSVPFLLGNITSPLIVGGFVQDLELKPGVSAYEVDVRGAKFALGKTLTIQIGGNKTLIKKLKLKTKAPKQPVKFGTLYLGDTNRDNKINDGDFQRYLDSVPTQDEYSDVNADGVVNSLDWAILIVNFGRIGNR